MELKHAKCFHPMLGKMVKGGCWDVPAFIVGCYGFSVVVQCFFPAFDVLCVGGFDAKVVCGRLVWMRVGFV